MRFLITLITFLTFTMANAQPWTDYTTDDGLIEGIISTIIQDSDGTYWFGDWSIDTSAGIGFFDGTNWGSFAFGDGPASNRIGAILQDSQGNYWFGSFLDPDGLSMYDGSTWIIYTVNDGLPSNDISSIIEDSQGNIWIGTNEGVSVFDGTSFTNYSDADGLISNNVSKVLIDNNGDLWVTTFDAGVSKFDGTIWTSFDTSDGLVANDVYAVYQDVITNDLWFGTFSGQGLSRFDGTTWTTFTTADGLYDNRVRAITQGSDGSLWFVGTGVSKLSANGVWTTYDETDGLISNLVRSVIEDSDQNIWFGTFVGVSRFNPSLGIFDELDLHFTIYPNPVTQYVHWSGEENPITKIEVFSLTGQKIETIKNPTERLLDVSKLTSGNYLLVFTDNNQKTGFRKLVKD